MAIAALAGCGGEGGVASDAEPVADAATLTPDAVLAPPTLTPDAATPLTPDAAPIMPDAAPPPPPEPDAAPPPPPEPDAAPPPDAVLRDAAPPPPPEPDAAPPPDAVLPDAAPPRDAVLPDAAPPPDAVLPDAAPPPDAVLPDAAPPPPPEPDGAPPRDAVLPDAAPPPAPLCPNGPPGTFERCDGLDDDCDGVADEGCEDPLHGLRWAPLRRAPGLDGACPADLLVRGAAACTPAGLSLPPAAVADWFRFRQSPGFGAAPHLAVPVPALADFRVSARVRVDALAPAAAPGSAFAYLGLLFDDEAPAGGFPGSIAGLTFPPEELPRFYYRGTPSSGGGRETLRLGVWHDLSVERVGALLITRLDGAYAGHTQSPGELADGSDGRHGALTGVLAACVDCTATIADLAVEVPENVVEPVAPPACDNRVRNGDFAQGLAFGTPVAPDVLDGPCCAAPTAAEFRTSLDAVRPEAGALRFDPPPANRAPTLFRHPLAHLPAGASVLSFTARTAAPARIEALLTGCTPGSVTFDLAPDEARASAPLDCAAGGAGVLDLRAVEAAAPVFVDDLQLAGAATGEGFCSSWRDAPEAARPVFTLLEPDPVFEITPVAPALWSSTPGAMTISVDPAGLSLGLWAPPGATEGLRLTLSPEDHPRGVSLDLADADACAACGPAGEDIFTWHVSAARLRPDAAAPRVLSLALETSAGRESATLVQSEDALETPPPPDFAPWPAPPWADAVRIYTLHSKRLGPGLGDIVGASHFAMFRDLGLSGVGLVNPHQNEMPALVAQAGAAGLPVDLQTFFGTAFWRDDANRAAYFTWAQGVAAAVAACPDCPAPHWNFIDEPDVRPLAACTRDLSTNGPDLPGPLVPALVEAAAEVGCAPPCDAARARAACLAGFPAALDALATDLRAAIGPAVRLGVNVTGDGGLGLLEGFGDALDTLSLTNNWVGREAPWRLPLVSIERRRAAPAGVAIAAYGQISGPGPGFYTRGGPGAGPYAGNALLQVAAGAVMMRDFVWPPHDAPTLDAMGAVNALLAELAPVVPQGRLAPGPPTSHPDLVALAFRDAGQTVLIVARGAARARVGAVDVRGLLPDGPVEVLWPTPDRPEVAPVVAGGVLRGAWGAYEARVFRRR